VIEFAPLPDELGERVDLVLARRTGLSRAVVQAAVRAGEVTVGGAVVRPSHRLRRGEVVAGDVAAPRDGAPRPEAMPLDVRYSDERVLVVSKPAGLVTHPAAGRAGGTLVNALLALGGPLARRGTARPGIVHRLDKDTSGLLLVARDDAALSYLQDALRKRRVHRAYLALVRGRVAPASGTVDAPLGRHPARPTLRAVVAGGRPAVTHYARLAADDRASLLEVTLETGRTHQIRVHLSFIGHPVLADRAYGGASELSAELGLRRLFLHAHRLTWPHPDGGRVSVSDELPPDLAEALRRAGLGVPEPSPRRECLRPS
jgi:23S rRNA pseudouridine1911/1915/1917 synthase